jgi:hypothetical protein
MSLHTGYMSKVEKNSLKVWKNCTTSLEDLFRILRMSVKVPEPGQEEMAHAKF